MVVNDVRADPVDELSVMPPDARRRAEDPRAQGLVVQLNENESAARLVRMSVTGGPTEPITVRGDARLHPEGFLGPQAVRGDGRIVVAAASNDSWFYGPAILDPGSGTVRKASLRYDVDVFSLSWNQKNEIVTAGFLMRSSLWRFRQGKKQ